ncbi:MAG: cytochrome P450 [Nannocystaceae bacterium]|nr:cytochrome P450 [Nannocystaceae bacterium]
MADDGRDVQWTRAQYGGTLAGQGPFALSADGVDLVAVRTSTGLRVFEGRCPHQGALLGEGELDGGTLVCRNHRWRFDASSGRRDVGPQCLRACPSQQRADGLFVDTCALQADPQTKAKRQISALPGPKGWPILGMALDLPVDALHLTLERWAREYGPLFRFRAGLRTFVVASDPEIAHQALRARPEVFRRDKRVEPVFAELGVAGVFSVEGAAWRPQRRLAMDALSQRHLRDFYATLAKVAARLHARWRAAAASGEIVDLPDDLMRFTVDVTTSLAFGCDLNTLEGGEDVIQRELSLVFPTFARRLNAMLPYWRLFRLAPDRRVDKAIATLRVWIAELVAQARAKHEAEPTRQPENFLEAMVAGRDEDGKPFTDEVLFGNAMTMLLAGEDTTANSVAWAVHLLCDHPDEVAALRAQLDDRMGDTSVPADLEVANHIDRGTAIANEAMRLRPVAPLNFVQANCDTVLGDLHIPAGTPVVILARIAATDAAHFGEPERFLPARWLEKSERAHDPGASMPFGSGPRICPGRSLALLEMRVLLATLYKSFDVERVTPADQVREVYSFTVMPSALEVRLRARSVAPDAGG